MIRWNVKPLMAEHELTNPSQLATFAGLTYPAASRMFEGEELKKIDTKNWLTVIEAFGLQRTPCRVLDIQVPTRAKRKAK